MTIQQFVVYLLKATLHRRLAHAIEIVAGSTRPDVVTEDDQRAGLQSGAPQVEAGYYLVPRVLE